MGCLCWGVAVRRGVSVRVSLSGCPLSVGVSLSGCPLSVRVSLLGCLLSIRVSLSGYLCQGVCCPLGCLCRGVRRPSGCLCRGVAVCRGVSVGVSAVHRDVSVRVSAICWVLSPVGRGPPLQLLMRCWPLSHPCGHCVVCFSAAQTTNPWGLEVPVRGRGRPWAWVESPRGAAPWDVEAQGQRGAHCAPTLRRCHSWL